MPPPIPRSPTSNSTALIVEINTLLETATEMKAKITAVRQTSDFGVNFSQTMLMIGYKLDTLKNQPDVSPEKHHAMLQIFRALKGYSSSHSAAKSPEASAAGTSQRELTQDAQMQPPPAPKPKIPPPVAPKPSKKTIDAARQKYNISYPLKQGDEQAKPAFSLPRPSAAKAGSVEQEQKNDHEQGAVGGAGVDIHRQPRFAGFNNTCSEEAVTFICSKYGFPEPEFNEAEYLFDVQIDLLAAISLLGTDAEQFHQGHDLEHLYNYFESKDQQSCYLLRSGKNLGSGHFAVLHHHDRKWRIHSSSTNKKVVISDGKLTEDAVGTFHVPDKTKWGTNNEQYTITSVKIPRDPTLLKKLAQFINASRSGDEDTALATLFS